VVLLASLLGEEAEEVDLRLLALEVEEAVEVVALWLITKSMVVDAVIGRPGTYFKLLCSARQQDSTAANAALIQSERVLEIREWMDAKSVAKGACVCIVRQPLRR